MKFLCEHPIEIVETEEGFSVYGRAISEKAARLIYAAPELLDALNEITGFLMSKARRDPEERACISKANAAISKAASHK